MTTDFPAVLKFNRLSQSQLGHFEHIGFFPPNRCRVRWQWIRVIRKRPESETIDLAKTEDTKFDVNVI